MGAQNEIDRYDNVGNDKLKSISNTITKADKESLFQITMNHFSKYFNVDYQTAINLVDINYGSLLGVRNAIIINKFNEYPFDSYGIWGIAGWACLIEDPLEIPCICLMPDHNKNTLAHEKIHILQYLQSSSYPMNNIQKSIFLKMSLPNGIEHYLENHGESPAIDYLINSTCYKFWIELEANYFAENWNNIDFMKKVYKSALPIMTFQGAFEEFNFGGSYMAQIRSRFVAFCEKIETEIDWVNNLLKESNMDSLHDWVYYTHDDIETDLLFGDMDDDDLEMNLDEEFEYEDCLE